MKATGITWIGLSDDERKIVTQALAALQSVEPHLLSETARLAARLDSAASLTITVGVYGGVVQWVKGNPVPVRVFDYDGDAGDLTDEDNAGCPCSIGNIAVDPSALLHESSTA